MREFTDGVIYKLIKYSDNSAIALAYTRDFGKVKLFIPKAFTKSGGISLLVPGEIDFQKKDNSELNKLFSFKPYYDYLFYAENPIISIRLNLFFEVYESLYGIGEQEDILWSMLTKIDVDNISKVLLFAIFAMLNNNGHMFNFHECSSCGKVINDSAKLSEGEVFCIDCIEQGYTVDEFTLLILRAFRKRSLYQTMTIKKPQEIKALNVLIKHVEFVSDRKIKSYKVFKELVDTLS